MENVLTVTFHLANNYGAVLQAFALQKALLKKYNTKILNYDNENISRWYKLYQPGNNISSTCYHYLRDTFNYKKEKKRIDNFEAFRNHLKLTNYYNNISDVKKELENFDSIITGSDQVWNPNITGGFDDVYLLNFPDSKIRKISYAASCGNTNNILENVDKFKNKCSSINKISVRENSLNDTLSKIIKKEIITVIDPTLLLDKDDWIHEFDLGRRIIYKKYIFIYSVANGNKLFYDVINKIAKKTGYMVVYFDRNDIKNRIKAKKKSCYWAGPKEFLNLLYNSELVITTSFHGAALSALFNKKMFVILSTYVDRINTLYSKIGLSNRIINDIDEVDDKFSSRIEWNKINKLLEKEKKFSIKWLYDSIDSNGENCE